MRTIIFQALEFTVLIPGMLLAYLPVNSSLKQKPKKMIAWMPSSSCHNFFFEWICMQQISFINKNDSSAASVSYAYPLSGNTANLTMEIRQHLSCCLCSFFLL